MSVAWKCDICGKFYPKMEARHVLKLDRTLTAINGVTNVFIADVCDRCTMELSAALCDNGCTDGYIAKMAARRDTINE